MKILETADAPAFRSPGLWPADVRRNEMAGETPGLRFPWAPASFGHCSFVFRRLFRASSLLFVVS
jgi:hypothetical protein